MPRPYSADLRTRVLLACSDGMPPSLVARRFRVGRASVYLWLKQQREEGRSVAKPMGGGPKPLIRGEGEAALRRLVLAENQLSLAEYRDRLAAEDGGVRVHPWTVGRALQRLGLTRKKAEPARRRAG